jgi:hypothetical protein
VKRYSVRPCASTITLPTFAFLALATTRDWAPLALADVLGLEPLVLEPPP